MAKKCDLHKKESKTCDLHKATTGRHGGKSSMSGYEKGVHLPIAHPSHKGKSVMGTHVREPMAGYSKEAAKIHAKVTTKETKDMPRPNLGKCELHKSVRCDLHKSESEGEKEQPKDNHGAEIPEDQRNDDCDMCQDLDAQENADGTAGMHDCPECSDYDAKNNGDNDGCPECLAYDNEQNETGENDGCPECAQYDAQDGVVDDMSMGQAHPEVTDDAQGIHPNDCPQCQKLYSDASENQPAQTGQEDPNLQGHETAEEVLDMLDQEPGKGVPPSEEAKQIDDTEMPQGDQMKGGTAVTDNFGPAQKNDISDADKDFQEQTGGDPAVQENQDGQEDSPDMRDVLQGGLDEHAQEQKKNQVVDMVAQTLQGFKANKEFLETAKEQNPGLYQSTIQMLKAMISLCELLGLEPKMQSSQPPAQETSPEQSTGAAVAPGHSPGAPPKSPAKEGQSDPKAQGQV